MKTATYLILAITLGLAADALACTPGQPGPGKGNPAILGQGGDSKAKFNNANQEFVQLDLLDRALKNVARLCGSKNLVIRSGYRDPARNQAVGGAKKSQHMCGNAADIELSSCNGKSKEEMFKILARAGCGGIGCYPEFLQCDIGPKRSWGCPEDRPPPDDPKDDKPSKQQPEDKFVSNTPPEPQATGGVPSPGAPGGSSPGTQASHSPPLPERAAYPVRSRQQSKDINEMGDMRGPLNADKSKQGGVGVGTGKKDPISESSITRHGDRIPEPGNYSGETRFPSASGGHGTPPSAANSAIGSVGSSSAAGGALAAAGLPSPPTNDPKGPNLSQASSSGRGVSGGSASGSSSSGTEAASGYSTEKSLGSNKLAANASETEAAIRSIQEKEFGAANETAPASHSIGGIGGRDDDLFLRCRSAHIRSLRGGRVSASGGRQ